MAEPLSREEIREKLAQGSGRAPRPGSITDIQDKLGVARRTPLSAASNRRAPIVPDVPPEYRAAQQAFEADYAAIREQRPEEVQDWANIAKLAIRAGQVDEPETQELKNALIWQYGDKIKQFTEVEAGPEWWEENYTPPPEEDLPWWQDALKTVQPGLEWLDQWGQLSLGAVSAVRGAIDPNDQVSVAEGLRGAAEDIGSMFDPVRPVSILPGIGRPDRDAAEIETAEGTLTADIDGDGLNLREALGRDPDEGGLGLAALDLIGSILLDPTTYITLGSGSLARVGMKGTQEAAILATRNLADDAVTGLAKKSARELAERAERDLGKRLSGDLIARMNTRIASRGWRSLDDAERGLYDAVTRYGTQNATTRTGRSVADAQLAAIRRGGRSGVRFAGTTVAPTGRLGDVGRARGLLKSPVFGEQVAREAPAFRRAADATADQLRLFDDAVPSAQGRLGLDLAEELPEVTRTLKEIPVGRALTRLGPDGTERVLMDVVSKGTKRGILGELLGDTRVVQLLRKVSPRAAARAVLGDDLAERIGRLLSETRDDPRVNDMVIRLGADGKRGGAYAKSLREFATEEEWSKVVNTALSNRAAFDAAQETVGPATADLLRRLHTSREEIVAMAIEGGANPATLGDIYEYMPRVLSDVAKRNKDFVTELTERGLRTGAAFDDVIATDGMVRRTIAEGGPAREVINLWDANDAGVKFLREIGIDAPDQLWETNAVKAMIARSQSASAAAMNIEMIDGLRALRGIDGVPLAFKASPDDARRLTSKEYVQGLIADAGAKKGDFAFWPTPDGTVYAIDKTVMNEVNDVYRLISDPAELQKMGSFYDKMNNVWAASATVSMINPAFHVRNSVGNWALAFLGGTRDVRVFKRAGVLQAGHAQVAGIMRDTGATFADAIKRSKLSPEDAKILTQARKLGVINDGRALDLLREVGGTDVINVGSKRGLQLLNPFNTDNIINRPGRWVGTNVEENARLGVFIDQLNKGASPSQASAHVKQFLFDYGDLTRFESEKIRKISRFYTFFRKNAAIQMYGITRYPFRVANIEQVAQGFLEGFTEATDGDRSVPPWMAGGLVRQFAGTDVAFKVDTPFRSFQETIEILTQPPPEDLASQLAAQGYLASVFGDMTEMFSGVGPAAMDWMYEWKSGKDSFTNRRLDSPYSDEDHLRDNMLFRGFASLFPVLSRLEGYGARAGLTRDGEAQQDLALQAVNIISGLKTYQLTDQTDDTARYVLQAEIGTLFQDMRNQGIEVPTVDEMREAGDIQFRNRVAETLMYGWEEGEDGKLYWSNEVIDDRLLNIIPKKVRTALGLPDPGTTRAVPRGSRPDVLEGSPQELYELEFDFDQARQAIEELLGRELSQDERKAMLSAYPGGLGLSEQEQEGIDPTRENRLLDPEKTAEEEEAAYLRKREIFESRMESLGFTWEELMQAYPRIDSTTRGIRDRREAGYTEEEILQEMFFAADEGGSDFGPSRADRAAINQLLGFGRTEGPIPLTTERYPITNDPETLAKLRTKAWEASEELKIILELTGFPPPTDEQLFYYVANTLTKTEQRLLGIDPLKGAPSREDVRPDEVQAQMARDRFGALGQGAQEGPFIGRLPITP